jgi:hypothetical protein
MQSRRGVRYAAGFVLVATLVACDAADLDGPHRPALPFVDVPHDALDAGVGDADAAVTACSPTLPSLQSTILMPLCATAGCHAGKSAAAALDFTRADVGPSLISVAASSCDGHTLVVPGDPDASLLLAKMSGHVPSGCGEVMPPGSSGVAPNLLECVRGWIGALARTSDAGAGDGAACESCGSSSCVDLTQDALHCGTCATRCPSGSGCVAGQCQCPTGFSLCNGLCVDLRSDPAHCGSCTQNCGANSICDAGQCACSTGLTNCSGSCVETRSDPNHCQGCNITCSAGQLCTPTGCSSGGCGGLTKCGSACVDTMNSLSHCGGCGVACAPGQTCQAGDCVCPNSASLCGSTCTDTTSNALNCGSCGHACPPDTTCNAGSCACAGGKTLCGDACLDTNSDPRNCGGCGVVCGAGKTCMQGSCACASGPVSFASVASILADNCTNAGCHAGVAPKEGLNLTAAKAYAELVNVKASQCNDGRLLVPTNGSGQSYLLQKLYGQSMCSGSKMPKADSMLPAGELALIEGWICNGAKP